MSLLTNGINAIYIFGDSLLDTGKLHKLTEGKLPTAVYFKGRFSNGPVVSDYLLGSLAQAGIGFQSCKNYAVGGAMIAHKNTWVPPAMSVFEQMEHADPEFNSNDLVIVCCGANNYVFFIDIHTFPYIFLNKLLSIQSKMREVLSFLINKGAKNIILFNIPDIFSTPVKSRTSKFISRTLFPVLQKHIIRQNLKIKVMVDSLKSNEIRIELFDIYSLLKRVLESPGQFGFNNASVSVIPGFGAYDGEIAGKKEQAGFFFWDYVHPSTRAHKFLAVYLEKFLEERF